MGAIGPGSYVDPSADCPGVGTIAEPWCDLQEALDNAVAGDALFLAGGVSAPYPAFTVDAPVGLFGGFEGGYQDLSGYNPGTWIRDTIQLPARVEPGADVPVTIELQAGASGTTIEDFVVFGSTMTTGSVTTIQAGDFPDGVQLTLAHNTLVGGSTPYGNSTVVSIYDSPGQSVLVGNAINGGHSGGGGWYATGVQLLTRAVLGGVLVRNNDIWGPSMTTLFEYYEGTGYVSSNDLALLNACTWL